MTWRAITCVAYALMSLLAGPAAALDQRVGQAWHCPASDGAPAFVYVIGRIDTAGALLGVKAEDETRIVSVSIVQPEGAPGHFETVQHMPVAASGLGLCGERYLGEGYAVNDGFEGGYAVWLEAFQAGEAGIWNNMVQGYAVLLNVIRNQGG